MVESVGTSGTQDAYATMRARRHSSARVHHDGTNSGDLSGVQAGSGVADRDDWTRAANAAGTGAGNGAVTQTQATTSPNNPVNAQITAFLLQFQDVASGQGAANANGASTGGDNGSTDALSALPDTANAAATPSSGTTAFDAAFARLDANGDGSIDRNEAQAAVRQSQSRHHHHHHGGGHGGGTTSDPATATAATTAASTAAAATGNTLSAALLAQLQAA